MDFNRDIMLGTCTIEYGVNEAFLIYEIENGKIITSDTFWMAMSSIIKEFKISSQPNEYIDIALVSKSGGHYAFGTTDIDDNEQSFVSKEAIYETNANSALYHIFQIIFVKDKNKIPNMINRLEHDQNEIGYIIKNYIEYPKE